MQASTSEYVLVWFLNETLVAKNDFSSIEHIAHAIPELLFIASCNYFDLALLLVTIQNNSFSKCGYYKNLFFQY